MLDVHILTPQPTKSSAALDVGLQPDHQRFASTAGSLSRSLPTVSIVMANHNGACFVEQALRSALRQTLSDIEIIVSDDASTDDSAARILAISEADPRVRLIRRVTKGGAAMARNTALDVAGGTYIAIMDSDDLMHPDRLRRLVALIETNGADLVADDLLMFDDASELPPASLLDGRTHGWIDAAAYVDGNSMNGGPALGYLKPLIRRKVIETYNLRYDQGLSIAEDYAFVLQLLVHGARFWIDNDMTYFYRRRSGSLSHRLSKTALLKMQIADAAFVAPRAMSQPFEAARARRSASLNIALQFEHLVDALKQRRLLYALSYSLRHPKAALRLRGPVRDRMHRLFARSPNDQVASVRRSVCLLSRQRVIGATNGSSAYLLSLCRALDAKGFDVHLVSPSPAVFGSWPALLLRAEMGVFKSIRVRGAWRFGKVLVARDVRVCIRGLLIVAARLLSKTGIGVRVPKADYAIGVAWRREDLLFVAQEARANADAILADYAFLTAGIAYTLRPDSPSAVVMHDMFSNHRQPNGPRPPSMVRIDALQEAHLLSAADAIVAIQADEAAEVSRLLPGHRVILAPMAVRAVAYAQPGRSHSALFVGSDTGPNIDGLNWLLDEVWPQVRLKLPKAELVVAGGVSAGVRNRPDGVCFLGHVDNLADVYRDAGVVVSPLRHGSGLKIKLVEALANGKACIVTGVTVQGVEDITRDAVIRADDAATFAAELMRLFSDKDLRVALGTRALGVARANFSIESCGSDLTDFFVGGLQPHRGALS